MDGELRKALEDTKGQSEYIFAVVADIRGFSAFSRRHDSREVATYVKRVYIQLIDDYFSFANFYKATGDGLLIAIPFEDENLKETAQRTVDACVKCVSEFADICKSDPMVHFPVPDKIGFGVAWGAACCLVSADNCVLDYSGHLLNLASRLMDLARPEGVVLDGAFGIELLTEDTRGLFVVEEVYIRSVAENEPIRVHVLKDAVQVPEQARRPVSLETWETKSTSFTMRKWKQLSPRFRIELPKRLKRSDGMIVQVIHQTRRSGKLVEGVVKYVDFNPVAYQYQVIGNQPLVSISVDWMLTYARGSKLRLDQDLEVRISYVPE